MSIYDNDAFGKILGDISVDAFFRDYWQKKPLIIRNAFDPKLVAGDQPLISPEELAGYSLEPDIESRLITNDLQWTLEHGPLDESVFSQVPESHWTLLVQSLDYFHPPLQQLIKSCDFIPRWRLDDVMVSYATNGGGVGPHLDKYDVFLIQGQGQRRWRVGHKDQLVVHFSPHPEIAQIEPFEADMDIIVNAGDMLYIPPNTPHWGESIDESICYSVGFRAPNIGSIIQTLLQTLIDNEQTDLDTLWQDGGKLSSRFSDGQLHSQLDGWAQDAIFKLFNKRDLLIAIGKQVTELKYPEAVEPIDDCEANELSELAFVKHCSLHPLARMAYFEDDLELLTFINGEYFQFPLALKPIIRALNLNQVIEPQNLRDTPKHPLREFFSCAFLLGALEIVA
ncbi:MAG: cupin domain-containing protein [Kangiellaceae bacterium]|nr:cupin domain-containing protein [Kangiellaceae bacterium]